MDLLSIWWRRPRRSQVVPELNQYPETPAVVNPYPGWEVHFEPTRDATNRKHQLNPSNPVHPLTPPYIAWVTHFEPTKNATNRRLITDLELDNYPATPVVVLDGYYPGFEPTKPIRSGFNRIRLRLPELNVHPATPTGYYSGYYPGSEIALSERVSYRVRLQSVPELNTYPATPAPDQPLTGWITHFEPTKNATNRRNLGVELNSYPVTPVALVEDYYAGAQLITANRISFTQTAQQVPELNTRPLAARPATLPAYLEWKSFRHGSNYELLTVPVHNEYPETPPEIPAERVGSMLAAKHVRKVMRRGR